MSFSEAAAQLDIAAEKCEEISTALLSAKNLVDELHAILAGVYDGVDAGDEILSKVDSVENEIEEVIFGQINEIQADCRTRAASARTGHA